MYFSEGRINRIVNDIRKLIYTGSREILDIQIRYGEIPKPVALSFITDGWQEYLPGTPWTKSAADTYALFKTKVVIPEEFDGKKVVLSIQTGRIGWNALNPQMLLYIDGKECQRS